MVTSTYHLNRAELMLARCYQGERRAVAASPDLGIGSWAMRVAHEWLGHLHARVVARGC